MTDARSRGTWFSCERSKGKSLNVLRSGIDGL